MASGLVILIESGVRFARPFVTPFNVMNETAIRSLCGGKAESSGWPPDQIPIVEESSEAPGK